MVDNLEERTYRGFEDKHNSVQKMKMNCLLLFNFCCTESYAKETEPLVDLIESLRSSSPS